MSQTMILVNDPDLYKEITSDHLTYVRDVFFSNDVRVIGRGLFGIDGPEWKIRREKLNPFFSKKRIDEHFGLINESCKKMIAFALKKDSFDLRGKFFFFNFFFFSVFFFSLFFFLLFRIGF